MPSVAVHNGRYVKKNLTAQTISGAISWRLVRDLQSGVPARSRLLGNAVVEAPRELTTAALPFVSERPSPTRRATKEQTTHAQK